MKTKMKDKVASTYGIVTKAADTFSRAKACGSGSSCMDCTRRQR